MPVFYEQDIKHYGVKGMRWGVRRYRSKGSKAGAVARKLLVGDEKRSLATERGRRDFKKNVRSDVKSLKKIASKISKNKVFKTLVYDRDRAKKLIPEGKKKVDNVLNNKVFKTLVYDHARMKELLGKS